MVIYKKNISDSNLRPKTPLPFSTKRYLHAPPPRDSSAPTYTLLTQIQIPTFQLAPHTHKYSLPETNLHNPSPKHTKKPWFGAEVGRDRRHHQDRPSGGPNGRRCARKRRRENS